MINAFAPFFCACEGVETAGAISSLKSLHFGTEGQPVDTQRHLPVMNMGDYFVNETYMRGFARH